MAKKPKEKGKEVEPEAPKGSFKGKLEVKKLKKLSKALNVMTEAGTVVFDKEGARISSMDASQIALIDVHYHRKDFTKFTLDGVKDDAGPFEFGLDVTALSNYLKPIDADSADLTLSASHMKLATKQEGFLRDLMVRAVDTTQPPKLPVIDYTTSFRVSAGTLNKICKEADALNSTYLTITVKPKGVEFLLENDNDRLGIFLPVREDAKKFGVEMPGVKSDGEEVSSVYAVSFVQKIIAGASPSDMVDVQMAHDKPLHIAYPLASKSRVDCWLAPRLRAT